MDRLHEPRRVQFHAIRGQRRFERDLRVDVGQSQSLLARSLFVGVELLREGLFDLDGTGMLPL